MKQTDGTTRSGYGGEFMRGGIAPGWDRLSRWFDGPASLVAERLLSSRKGAAIRARISEDAEIVHLRPAGKAGSETAISLSSPETATLELASVVRGKAVEIAAPRTWLIERRIDLPLEAGDHLDGIVAARIGTLSPLPASEMLYGHRIVQSDRTSRRMAVAIVLLPRSRAMPLLDIMDKAGARNAEIVAPLSQGGTVRLHPRRAGAHSGLTATKALLALLLAASLLGAGATLVARGVYAGIEARERAAIETRATAARERIAARLAPDAAGTVPEQRALEIKNEAISALGALDDLAAALPQHAYTTEVVLRDDRLRVTGHTLDVPEVLTALESSGRFAETGLVGPTTRSEDGTTSLFLLETRPLIRTGGALR